MFYTMYKYDIATMLLKHYMEVSKKCMLTPQQMLEKLHCDVENSLFLVRY